MRIIFTGHGIEIGKEENDYYLIYDAGEISDRMEKIKISEQEAKLAMKGSMEAYEIIIKYQNEME